MLFPQTLSRLCLPQSVFQEHIHPPPSYSYGTWDDASDLGGHVKWYLMECAYRSRDLAGVRSTRTCNFEAMTSMGFRYTQWITVAFGKMERCYNSGSGDAPSNGWKARLKSYRLLAIGGFMAVFSRTQYDFLLDTEGPAASVHLAQLEVCQGFNRSGLGDRRAGAWATHLLCMYMNGCLLDGTWTGRRYVRRYLSFGGTVPHSQHVAPLALVDVASQVAQSSSPG